MVDHSGLSRFPGPQPVLGSPLAQALRTRGGPWARLAAAVTDGGPVAVVAGFATDVADGPPPPVHHVDLVVAEGVVLRLPAAPHTGLAACAAAGRADVAAAVLSPAADADEVRLVRGLLAWRSGDPDAVVALGVPEPDTIPAALSTLLRAHALLAAGRHADATHTLASLDALAGRGSDAATALLRARHLPAARAAVDAGDALRAAEQAVQALQWDPLHPGAYTVLGRAQAMARSSTRHDRAAATGGAHPSAGRVQRSLERELAAARGDLADLTDDLARIAAQRDEVLGPLLLVRVDLQARLAAAIHDLSGAADDAHIAARLADELRREETAQRRRRDGRRAAPDAGDAADEAVEAAPEPAVPVQSPETAVEAKVLYRRLVRRWHPDRATDDEDRATRTRVLRRVLAAYQAGDVEVLRGLWAAGDQAAGDHVPGQAAGDHRPGDHVPGDPAAADEPAGDRSTGGAESAADGDDAVVRAAADLAAVRDELDRLLGCDLERWRAERDAAAAAGRDLLAEERDRLLDEITALRAVLDETAAAQV